MKRVSDDAHSLFCFGCLLFVYEGEVQSEWCGGGDDEGDGDGIFGRLGVVAAEADGRFIHPTCQPQTI
jgi:hypothetical protein